MNTIAPDITPGYPSNSRKIGSAWNDVWDVLQRDPDEYVDGAEIARQVAERHDLAPATLTGMFTRAATAGLLERTYRPTQGTRGTRQRACYRIKREA